MLSQSVSTADTFGLTVNFDYFILPSSIPGECSFSYIQYINLLGVGSSASVFQAKLISNGGLALDAAVKV